MTPLSFHWALRLEPSPDPRGRDRDDSPFAEGKTKALRNREAGQGPPGGERQRCDGNPNKSTTNGGPRFKGTVFLGSNGHSASEGASTSCCPPTGLRTSISGVWGPNEEAGASKGPLDAAWPQFPLRAAPSQYPMDRGSPSPSLTSPYGPWSPGNSEQWTPRLAWLSAEPPTHLSSGRTPTHRRLRLRTAALPAPPPERRACAEDAVRLGLSFCAGAAIIPAGVGASDAI